MSIRPRRTVHQGTVTAAGLWLADRALLLENWRPASSLYRAPGQTWILLWPSPQQIDTARCRALPLVKQANQILATAPLSEKEAAELLAPAGSIVLVRHGECTTLTPGEEHREDPSQWLDLSPFQLAQGQAFAPPPEPPLTAYEAVEINLHERLAGDPERGRAAARFLEGLTSQPQAVQKPGLLDRLKGYLQSWLPSASSSATATASAGATDQAKLPLSTRISNFITRALMMSQLGRLAGARHARYLSELFDKFDSGDLESALRHAIPLAGIGEAIGKLAPPWQSHNPRSNLDLSFGPREPGRVSTIPVGERIMNALRERYRQAFDRLVARGKIEEAAFILAELLNENEEAVALLERHGRLKLAAELAESRGLRPALVVRQWFLAGDIARACQIAIRAGENEVFREAIALLESKQKNDTASELRQIYANRLADSGDYAGAFQAVANDPRLPELARLYVDRAIEAGGVAGAKALAQKVRYFAGDFTAILAQARTLLESTDAERASARSIFGLELLNQKPPAAESKILAALSARSTLRDIAAGFNPATAGELRRLADFSGDAALRADLPKPSRPAAEAPTPLDLEIAAADRGATPIADAAFLPNGRTLAALGEGGSVLLAADGRVIARFRLPAENLIVADNGNKALTLARRGHIWTVGRIDLVARRESPWCEARIDSFAPDFDGSLWFTSHQGNLFAIDTNSARFESVWEVRDLGPVIGTISRNPTLLELEIYRDQETIERWTYQLPGLALRSRDSFPARTEVPTHTHVAAYDQRDFLRDSEGATSRLAKGHFVTVQPIAPLGSVIAVLKQLQPSVRVALHGSGELGCKVTESTITIADNIGRIVVVDLTTNRLLRNLRF